MEQLYWFKFYTNFFKRQSITIFSSMKKGEAIILTLIKLMCMAAEINDRGYVYLTPQKPYSVQMLASYMGKSVKVMKEILLILEEYGEIEIESDGMIIVNSWSEEQSIDKLEKIREQYRIRKQRQKERRQNELNIHGNVHGNVTGIHGGEKDTEKEKDKESDIDKYIDTVDTAEYRKEEIKAESFYDDIDVPFYDDDIYLSVISYLNEKLNTEYSVTNKLIRELITERLNEGYKKEDFCRVIDNKIISWKGTDYEKFLRPETLFGKKFDLYLNEKQPDAYDYSRCSFDVRELDKFDAFSLMKKG